MSDPFLSEIRLFSFLYAPRGWALCNGQLLPINQNQAVFSLLGTTYGGNGQTTFALPDLRGRLPIHFANNFVQGQTGGVETVTLTAQQIPSHSHPMLASSDPANSPNPAGHVLAETASTTPYYNGPPAVPLAPQSIASTGGSQPHDNLQPFLCLNYIISLFGIFPPPN